MLEQQTVAFLFAAMGENGIVAHVFMDVCGGQQAGCHDEAIDENHHFLFCCAQHRAYGGNHFKATEISECGGRGKMLCVEMVQGFRQNVVFMGYSCLVKSRASPDAIM